jgi:hypothetical protein
MAKKYDVFISYSLKDRAWARNLFKALQERGISVWYDENEVRPGDSLLDRIHEGLNKSHGVIFLISAGASKSNWAAAELGAALALHKLIIPIVQEGISPEDIPGPIRLRRYLLKQEPSITAEEIVQAISTEQEMKKK